MKNKIKKAIELNSIKNIIKNNPQISKEKIKNAEKGDILSMLYLGFVFYTGYDEYPISHSLSFQYYKKAANESHFAMLLLGYFYLNGIFFPQNLNKARECFKKAAQKGSIKAEIIDNLLRKHVWRTYLIEFDINEIIEKFLLSFDLDETNAFSNINYILENNLTNDRIYKLKLQTKNNQLKSNGSFYTNLVSNEILKWPMKTIPSYSEKVLLSNENLENINDANKQLDIGKSYFYGENGFPINYTKASKHFKIAAEKRNSEAQWRYALLIKNKKFGFDKTDKIELYLKKSAEQNNIKGKFLYSIFLRNNKKDNSNFEKLIKECCDAGDANSMYFYAMHLEEIQNDFEQCIEFYKKAANLGHFDAFHRLINLSKEDELYEDYLSIGILNDKFLSKLIEYYDKDKNYQKTNILIQIGIIRNPKLFNFYYSDHLLYGKGIKKDIEKAHKLANLVFKNNYPEEYLEKYIYIILIILVIKNEHKKALDSLLAHVDLIKEEYKDYFHSFYKKFDKILASQYYIAACFYKKQYRACHKIIMEYINGNSYFLSSFKKLLEYSEEEEDEETADNIEFNNPFAMAIVGKIYKKEKIGLLRNLEKALKYFARSAKLKCPLGYYYIGKEFFYGRYLGKNNKKAAKFLTLAIDEEPRAAYYLFKITRKIGFLEIGVKYGHKRALLKYGKILYNKKMKEEAIIYIRQACLQEYKAAYNFCIAHGIHFIDVIETYSKKSKKEKIIEGTPIIDNNTINSNNINDESTGLSINIQEDEDANNNNNNFDNYNDENDDSLFDDLADFWL